ncbi:hypothetical protein B0H15DRAFT_947151 [Mycena belliarum]|uniref:HNH nuclease domain-containing protein n=1 Tax=Mycena belliarum TaxID=1033014 RepID=A0AAD6TSX0_9AGAR|nr:hypothetical protein B0H15DRAFT_958252 [Mycena belliae]KAJ7069085.1 hypothetical protein B0H15DRAFT_968874 [Mycena belliae]KAJ7075758.1 hypothetical protein B0H15DRAFT_956255 [Mycena belliae]KAJ7094763.1 hypothetical protein B0H15DRAFT_947151 [Mycena belliae]
MSRLPSLADVQVDHNGRRIWPNLLSAERAALTMGPTNTKYNDPLIGIRVLGFLVQDLWQHSQNTLGLIPYVELIKQITSSLSISGQIVGSEEEAEAQHMRLQTLGLSFRNNLIRVFRSNGGPIPKQSDHSSRPSLDIVRDRIISEMKTPTTAGNAHKHALLRDGYRCMLTGQYDVDSVYLHPELRSRAAATHGLIITQCAHIFLENAQDGEQETSYAASAMAILEVFGHSSTAESLVGGSVHKHFNLLTMRSDLHTLFDHLDFWLEEVENTYTVVSFNNKVFEMALPPPPRVTFRVDPELVAACRAKTTNPPALPSPSLLAIRAACSRVAQMSGAAEQIDQILRDLEDTPVLAEDGGSAHLLSARLSQSSCNPHVKA